MTKTKSWSQWFFNYWVLPWNTGWQWRKEPRGYEKKEEE